MSLFGKERKIIREIPEFEPEPVETFTSPDDERSITVLIGKKNKITGAVLSESYNLSVRLLSRFYVLMRQVRYPNNFESITFNPIRIGYELFAVFNKYEDKVYVVNDIVQNDDDKKIEEIFKLKYVFDAENESIRNRRLSSVFNRFKPTQQEEIIRRGFEEKKFYNKVFNERIDTADNSILLDNFNTNIVLSYSHIQRELVLFFLNGIFKKYSLY